MSGGAPSAPHEIFMTHDLIWPSGLAGWRAGSRSQARTYTLTDQGHASLREGVVIANDYCNELKYVYPSNRQTPPGLLLKISLFSIFVEYCNLTLHRAPHTIAVPYRWRRCTHTVYSRQVY